MFHCEMVTDSNGTSDKPEINEENETKLTVRDAQEPERLLRQEQGVRDLRRSYGRKVELESVLGRGD